MTRLASYGTETVSLEALAQVLMINACLYHDRRDILEAYLGADATVRHWYHNNLSWTPSFCMVRQGNAWHVCFAGTTSINPQVIGHVRGYFRSSELPGGGFGNGAWLSEAYVWFFDWATVAIAEGVDSVYLAGHSYGGALADSLSVILAEQTEIPHLELLTVGEPPGWIAATPRARVRSAWPVASYGDAVVAATPYAAFIISGADFQTWLDWENVRAVWLHLHPTVWLGPGGQIGAGENPPDPLPPGVTLGPVTEHLLPNYIARTRAALDRYGGPPSAYAALLAAEAALSGGDPPVIVPAFPAVVRTPVNTTVTVPNWAGIETGLEPPSLEPRMAYPIPLTGGVPYRLTFKFNMGRWGWTENLMVYATGDGGFNPEQAIVEYMAEVNDRRKTVLSNQAAIVAASFSVDNQRQDADERVDPAYGFGPGLKSGTASPVYLGWRMRSEDVTNQVKANLLYRGFPDSLVANFANWAPGQAVPPEVRTFAGRMNTLLTAPFAGTGATLRACTKSRQRDPNVNPEVRILAMRVDDDGFLVIKHGSDLGIITRGDKLKVTLDRQQCLKGISGTYVVLDDIPVTGGFEATLRFKPCCASEAVATGIGTVQKIVSIYVPIAGYKIISPMKRDTGGAFFVGRGRSSTRCCR